ncbi:putative ABC transport system [Corynebacterium kutscheri]|uniref:ABC transport system n=1 Tax=Corynebacterium kutscheri TaxID=35755 RepID=A0AB38VRI2_9CORY|nr:ABC transporter ATP-binding protein [Corynebacterium kutscheri]VEH06009.1 putative ABC transport system [Corynebacterium kutscheri]VEH81915.1 putative ABC transport system [Corynebacterium kutscheri]
MSKDTNNFHTPSPDTQQANPRAHNAWLQWAVDIFLLDAYRVIFTHKGYHTFKKGLFWAGLIGVLEGIAIFTIIPAITSFISGEAVLGMQWIGWVVVLVGLAIIASVATYFQATASYLSAIDALFQLNIRLGNKITRIPLGLFTQALSTNLSQLMTSSMMNVGQGAAHFVGPIVRGLSTTVTMTILAFFWSWQLGLILLTTIPVMFLATTASRHFKARGENIVFPTSTAYADRILEFSATQPSLRSCGQASNYRPLLQAKETYLRAAHKDLWLGITANIIHGLSGQALSCALIIVSIFLGSTAILDPLAAVAFAGISLRFSTVLNELAEFAIAIEVSRKPVTEIQQILATPELPEATKRAVLNRPGEVVFNQVHFGYDPDYPVLKDIDFVIPPRSLTAIVGPSGSGKTTLFKLIARFWETTSGQITVGGVDVRDQPTEQLMEQLSMVFQDVYLYDTTLAENIRYGRADATDEEVRAAGELAGVAEIAKRLPGGWQARVGEAGKRLSGGERQRVSVARALLKGAPIVLFDEATSALDAENEAHISQSIADLRARSTVLVIAHKLDTICNADQILVLDESGALTQVGTHDELIHSDGVYRRLWQARKNAQGWSLT